MDDKWSALEKYNLWNGNSYKLGLLRTSYINKIHAFVGNKLVKSTCRSTSFRQKLYFEANSFRFDF